ncbi:MAG TPA: fatty acid desaturase, partial [Polyangia bacterium]|nr:fatty acid desaturase [Polyangia bacterium]
AFLIPLLHHRASSVIALYLLTTCALGFTLAVVFQLAHCVEEATFRVAPAGTKQLGRDFAAHQVETSVDFARDNRLLTWYLGGLNYQVEHHLFPKTCHVHYPALSPIIEAVCQQHGVAHRSHPTMLRAVLSHIRWLRQMGRPAEAPVRAREAASETGCQPA